MREGVCSCGDVGVFVISIVLMTSYMPARRRSSPRSTDEDNNATPRTRPLARLANLYIREPQRKSTQMLPGNGEYAQDDGSRDSRCEEERPLDPANVLGPNCGGNRLPEATLSSPNL